MLCSPHGLLHLQHILHHLLGIPGKSCWDFTCSHSRKVSCELWMATPPCLFGNWASPLSFPASSKQNYPWKTRFNPYPTTQGCLQHLQVLPTPTQHHSQMHQIHHWLSSVEKHFPACFSLLFPAPRQGLPAHIFPPALAVIPGRLLSDPAAFWQIAEPTSDHPSRFFAWFPGEMELFQPWCPPMCARLLS